jgi:hypothetical protein
MNGIISLLKKIKFDLIPINKMMNLRTAANFSKARITFRNELLEEIKIQANRVKKLFHDDRQVTKGTILFVDEVFVETITDQMDRFISGISTDGKTVQIDEGGDVFTEDTAKFTDDILIGVLSKLENIKSVDDAMDFIS